MTDTHERPDDAFRFDEKYLSQLPALQLLISLGYEYLTPAEAHAARGGKTGNVLLEEILRAQLKRLNRIHYKGGSWLFSEENVQSAIQRLKNVKYDGLLKTNEAVYDLLALGIALEQAIEGDVKSFTLNYVDWRNPANNVYHVAAEFAVERTRSHETVRPDLVLFVNGIPFASIECKSPKVDIEQAISQTIRNQREEFIPRLFTYVQLALALNKNEARYATAGTPAKFWSRWKEDVPDAELAPLLEKPLPERIKASLFDMALGELGVHDEPEPYVVGRQITEQDRALYALCRPQRLLELVWQYTVFDGGVRKIARYQQFFAIQEILRRVKQRDDTGRRRGGIVWHTQGSGKSLTMVMLARALALAPDIVNPRIVLVTDRVDLDVQLGNTFAACGLSPDRAESGRHLMELVAEDKAHIVTTLVHKFDKALNYKKFSDDSADIFALVDETQRTQLGSYSARMRQMFPRACYIGFTGTPLLTREKSDIARFGGLIHTYAIDQAVADGAIVPLLYEGRLVELEQVPNIDVWFDRHTKGLSDEQRADLKRKFARAEMLNKAEQVIYMRAFDISRHFVENWQGTGFKAQLVAPSKNAALRYKAFLDELGEVSSEVIISPPDEREGYDDIDADESADAVVAFWRRMMNRYGSEDDYNKRIVDAFKFGEEPEILIVVDKLLTGFDAPRNTVLYLARRLTDHTLLQAIARVNRLYDNKAGGGAKEFGFVIDYVGVLGDLDKALTTYSALAGFDDADLRGALTALHEESKQLPQRHAELWDIFKTVKRRDDEESFELLLGNEKLRAAFYDRLTAYAKTLALALSSERFVASTPERKLVVYKNDLKRFMGLKAAVKRRYAETVDYRDYEPRIQKLLDTHITASDAVRLNEPVNIFDQQAFRKVVEDQGEGRPLGAKADTIAHATKRAISERLEKDPAFYEKFSKLIQQAIDDYRARRLSDLEYLQRVSDIRDAVVKGNVENLPAALRGDADAAAVYGLLKPFFAEHIKDPAGADEISAEAAQALWTVFQRNRKVGYWDDLDAQRRTMNEIDDYLYDVVKGKHGIELTTAEMDEIIDKAMQLARHRMSA